MQKTDDWTFGGTWPFESYLSGPHPALQEMREGPGSSPSIRREPDRSLLRAIPSTDLAVLNKAGLLEYPIAFESENEENDPAPQFPMRDRFPPAVSVRTRCHGEERES